jgi:hypothetical protein
MTIREECVDNLFWDGRRFIRAILEVDPIRYTLGNFLSGTEQGELIGSSRSNPVEINHPSFNRNGVAVTNGSKILYFRLPDQPVMAEFSVTCLIITSRSRSIEGCFLHVSNVIGIIQMPKGVTFVMANAEISGMGKWHCYEL